MSLVFADVQAFIQSLYNTDPDAGPVELCPPILPQYDAELVKKSPQELIFATLGGGPGLSTEEVLDGIFLSLRVCGRQKDYASAETLALRLDTALLTLGAGNATMGSAPIKSLARSGGRPVPIDYDVGDRTHFQTTYVVTAQTGL